MKRNKEVAYSRALVPKRMPLFKKVIIGLVIMIITSIIIVGISIKL